MEQVFSLIQQYDFSILNYIWLYGHAHWLDIFMEEALIWVMAGQSGLLLAYSLCFKKNTEK